MVGFAYILSPNIFSMGRDKEMERASMKLDRIIAVRNDKTEYRDGDRCIKVFNSEYSKSDVLNEALNQTRANELGIRVPQISEVGEVNGKWAIISEYIRGKTLAQLISEDKDNVRSHIELFSELQRSVHSKDASAFARLSDGIKRKISLSDSDDDEKHWLSVLLEGLSVRDNSLCHGDFNPSNVIISNQGEPYIIDWPHAARGDAAADAAYTYLMFCINEDDALAHTYLDIFSEKSNISKKHIEKWMSVIAVSQSVKGNEKKREFLIDWEFKHRNNW